MRKDRVLNLRISEQQRATYERAAGLEGVAVSALVTSAADERAERILHAQAALTVGSEVFDRMLLALESPPRTLAPSLEKALDSPLFENK